MLILGSGSKARKALLVSVGLIPEQVLAPNIDETSMSKELPLEYVKRMALEKSINLKVGSGDVLITADTIVVVGRSILHKVNNKNDAREYLRLLSGRTHRVFTAFNVKYQNKNYFGLEKTFLKMKYLTGFEIDDYLKENEWQGRAGGYSIQGRAVKFFPVIKGCFSNIVGLPLPRLDNTLKGIGYYRNINNG